MELKRRKKEIDKTLSSLQKNINSYMSKISSSLEKVKYTASEFSNVGVSSHRQGLTYVPYDGYRAILHEGERVLTKEEAKANNVSGDTFIFNSPKAIDEREAARQMKLAKKQLAMDY